MYLATKVLNCFVFGGYNVTIFPILGVLRVKGGYMKYEPHSSGFFKLKERSIYFDIFFNYILDHINRYPQDNC